MSDRALGCRRTPSHAPAIPPHRGSPPAASRPGDCPHTGRSGTLPARDPDGVERIMGDDSMCVRQARTDVLGHQIRIVRKDPLHGLSLRQEAQDEFYRYPHPAENRLPAKDFRVGRNSLQEFFLCRWTIPFPLNSSQGHGEEHGVQEALLPTIFRVHGREGVGQSQEAPPAPMLRRKPLLLSVSPRTTCPGSMTNSFRPNDRSSRDVFPGPRDLVPGLHLRLLDHLDLDPARVTHAWTPPGSECVRLGIADHLHHPRPPVRRYRGRFSPRE